MDQKSKNIDCYFYYYSECARGNFCKFRHEPSALGCEVMCMKWKEGSCTEPQCSLRHMELKKKRREMPCYWERQPGGCRKAHCAFKHQVKGNQPAVDSPNPPECSKNDSDSATQDWSNAKSEGASSLESSAETTIEAARLLNENYTPSPPAVEPVVVNFEEESDSESAPSWTPTKVPEEKDTLHVKTLEEIRLEKVQAESAAYWDEIAGGPIAWEASNPAVNQCTSLCGTLPETRKSSNSSESDFRVLSLDEIRKNRARKLEVSVGIRGGRLDPSLDSKIPTNGYSTNSKSSREYRNHLGISDLRIKLSSTKSQDGSQLLSNTSCSWSTKRQRLDTSPLAGPSKKQRIRLRRLSDLTGESSLHTNKIKDYFYNETDIDDHFITVVDMPMVKTPKHF